MRFFKWTCVYQVAHWHVSEMLGFLLVLYKKGKYLSELFTVERFLRSTKLGMQYTLSPGQALGSGWQYMVQSAGVNRCRRTSASLSLRLQLEHTMRLGQHDCIGSCLCRWRGLRWMEEVSCWVRTGCIEGLWLLSRSKVLVSSSWAHRTLANSLCCCRPRICSLRCNWTLSCRRALASQRSVVKRKSNLLCWLRHTDLMYGTCLEKR